ncbi:MULTISPECIES: FHA domain-containing protein [Parabacteroides]|uniref:MJ0042 family finger-like domain-containing protein n=1 Tax=Parabacteroides chinchillae TaxID=871327 RepID=A0A8G2BUG8_9BACT|nr:MULTISPECIES: FHA domain-containing protein [Parabacteroides]SEF55107.1 MJ0042 family finger-like domain-containing protein [Parabacteroides chinchillae]
MISVKCPHCQVGLKVDEGKIPLGITSFKCPKCKKPIPISFLSKENVQNNLNDSETILVQPIKNSTGKLTIVADTDTPEQEFLLYEGTTIVGRKSNASNATIGIITTDRSMSREHIRIEVKKDSKGGYKHYLSDNNSKNHTLYNSNYLGDGEVVVLNNNDEIIIGRTVLRFNE